MSKKAEEGFFPPPTIFMTIHWI